MACSPRAKPPAVSTAVTASEGRRSPPRWSMAGARANRRQQRSSGRGASIWPAAMRTRSRKLSGRGLRVLNRDSGPLQSDVRMACRTLAHNKLGPIREERTLREALEEYERIEREDVPAMRLGEKARSSDKVRGEELESALSVRNLTLLGRILAIAALKRTESRGAHFRLDYPTTDAVP